MGWSSMGLSAYLAPLSAVWLVSMPSAKMRVVEAGLIWAAAYGVVGAVLLAFSRGVRAPAEDVPAWATLLFLWTRRRNGMPLMFILMMAPMVMTAVLLVGQYKAS